MRLWLVPPKELCGQHLLREHQDCHWIVEAINNGRNIEGHVYAGMIDATKIKQRHEELAKELGVRGYNHSSPLEYEDDLKMGSVSVEESRKMLRRRCRICREFQDKAGASSENKV